MRTDRHDNRCESEWIEGPMAYSPCGCAERIPRVALADRRWTVAFTPVDRFLDGASHLALCDSWDHALRVANRIARRQHREN